MTKLLNLSICASKEATIDQVRAVATPEPTESWYPISHDYLIERFKKSAAEQDLEVVQELHSLHRDGQRYFGLFQVLGLNRKHDADTGTVIGLRNSHDKAFAAAICAGDAPFVCTNLIFSNEIKINRKHTLNIMDALPSVFSRAIGRLGSLWTTAEQRHDLYFDRSLSDAEAHDLIIRAYRAGACGTTQIAKIAEQWHNPEHDEFSERNLWSLFNGFTNVYRGNLNALNARSDALHGVLDPFVGLQKVVRVEGDASDV